LDPGLKARISFQLIVVVPFVVVAGVVVVVFEAS
jgi:hypothetical protein